VSVPVPSSTGNDVGRAKPPFEQGERVAGSVLAVKRLEDEQGLGFRG
jgi:hypothetical protein